MSPPHGLVSEQALVLLHVHEAPRLQQVGAVEADAHGRQGGAPDEDALVALATHDGNAGHLRGNPGTLSASSSFSCNANTAHTENP